jgi:hypothetical protein
VNIDKLKLDKPAPLTNAERQKRWRAKQASRGITVAFHAHTEATAALIYLRKQWGFTSNQEAVEAALRHLALETRMGLKRIQLDAVDVIGNR